MLHCNRALITKHTQCDISWLARVSRHTKKCSELASKRDSAENEEEVEEEKNAADSNWHSMMKFGSN